MRTLDEIIKEEVYCVCSHLMSELSNLMDSSHPYYEDLMSLSSNSSYEYNYHTYYYDEDVKALYRVSCERPGAEIIYTEVLNSDDEILKTKKFDYDHMTDAELFIEIYAESIGIDSSDCDLKEFDDEEPDFTETKSEIHQHYIVSDWLGGLLKEEGETVVDFMGLTIWGRACSGQAVYMDDCFVNLYKKLEHLP